MDRLASMELFARVVECGGFSAAARSLGLSKSVVSKQVRTLEDRLGVRLLNRTTRRIALTEAGRAYLEGVERIAALVAQTEESVTHLQERPRGLLRINAPVSFGQLRLGQLIPDFMALYPEVAIDLTLSDRFVDLVEEGFDVAIRIGSLPDSSLIARRLAPVRRVVCASPAYLATHGPLSRVQDLERHDCLGYSYLSTLDQWRFHGPEGEVTVRVRGHLRANNGEVLREAAIAGVGVSLAPTFIVGEDLQAGRLVRLLPGYEPLPDIAIHAVHPAGRHVSPKLRTFVDFLAERFGPEPPWDCLEPLPGAPESGR
jgi:DNA-binding transcriptional LysR family regulator